MTPPKRWLIPPPLTPEADQNLAAFPPLLRQILFNRGYATEPAARAFLNAETGFAADPLQLLGMSTALDRIYSAIDQGEPIVIYGDYDVDGVTATALLLQTLGAFGATVEGYIPSRFDEGYGLNKEALKNLKSTGTALVISVDCGIRSADEARYAREIGLDLIISDHHHPLAGELPPALAVINPKQPGDPYPDKDLAGVGIAYKIAQAILMDERRMKFNGAGSVLQPADLLDLVALGTIADLAPLVGENRMLVRQGLNQIRTTKRQGLFALANMAEINLAKINTTHIGFMLGPRLNAAGRLESALAALDLLTTMDFMKAGQLAQQLEGQNRQRQALTRTTQEQAEAMALSDEPEAYLLFAAHAEFNSGVVGLAASRLAETHYRPAIVAAKGPEETRGSCRSIPEFHITDALDQCRHLLVRHGGHAAAAGFTVRNENLAELVANLKSLAAQKLSGLDLRATLTADADVHLSQMRPDVFNTLSELEPTGYGNPEATFVARDVKVRGARAVGADGRHLKLVLEDELGYSHDAIGFRLGHLQSTLPNRVDILFTYELNEYNGRASFQLNIKDVKPSGTSE